MSRRYQLTDAQWALIAHLPPCNTRMGRPIRESRVMLDALESAFWRALAIVLLTLLGKAGDAGGLEKTIKANTSKPVPILSSDKAAFIIKY